MGTDVPEVVARGMSQACAAYRERGSNMSFINVRTIEDGDLSSAESTCNEQKQPAVLKTFESNEDASSSSTRILHKTQYVDNRGQIIHEAKSDRPCNPRTRFESGETVAFEIIHQVTVHDVSRYMDALRMKNTIPAESWNKHLEEHLALNVNSVDTKLISIHSPRLIEAIQNAVTYYPGDAIVTKNGILAIRSPFRMLQVYKPELEELCKVEDDDREGSKGQTSHVKEFNVDGILRAQLELLLDTIAEDDNGRIAKEKEMWASTQKVTFDMLWLLLTPGTYVYTKVGGKLAGAVVRLIVWDSNQTDPLPTSATVHLWYLSFNGQKIQRRAHKAQIRWYAGARPIVDLPVYPINRAGEDMIHLEGKLRERGRKHYNLLRHRSSQWMYRGALLPDDYALYEGRVIVDPYTNALVNRKTSGSLFDSLVDELREKAEWLDNLDDRRLASSSGQTFRWQGFYDIDPRESQELDEDRYFLMEGFTTGFALKTRTWEHLSIENLHESKHHQFIEYNSSLKKQLRMKDDQTKNLMMTLATQFLKSQEESASQLRPDFIQGKGEGVSFLLYGTPGVGKTMTAEWIAEETKRPLLSISAAELGSDGHLFEQNLKKWFRFAESWRAIVLLDEADVYIANRGHKLTPNNLVSSLLRTMEYYRGVLFLTTNREGVIDPAILNRIHLGVEYKMTDEIRVDICNQLAEQYEESGFKMMDATLGELKRVANTIKLSGRSIRNTLYLAWSLANAENVTKISTEHMKEALRQTEIFQTRIQAHVAESRIQDGSSFRIEH